MGNFYKSLWLSVALLAVGACGGNVPKTDCNDGLDNDGDGFVDDADPGCPLNDNMLETPDPPPPPPKACGNGEDDDGDLLVDLADPGCTDETDTDETDPPPQCNDAVDNNGDGRMDFPGDPGCDSLLDEIEDTVTTVCSNGLDDDGDGATDYPDDVGCLSASDTDEFNQVAGVCSPNITVQPLVGGEANGVLPTGFNDLQSPVCGGLGAEAVFTVDVTSGPAALIISTDHPETTADTVVYVRSDCREQDTELGCNDDGAGIAGNGSVVILPDVPVGLYYIIVDGYPGDTGAFKLTVETRVGAGGACDPLVPDQCLTGYVCRPLLPGDPNTCELPECQDGLDNDADGTIDYPVEAGCLTLTDNSELIPAGDTIPACGNLVDDDADTLIDYPADPGCDAASDGVEIDECLPGKLVNYLDPVLGADGTTLGDTLVLSGSCGGIDGPEDVYAITPTIALTSMTIDTVNAQTAFDTIVYVRETTCATGVEVGCNDNTSPGVTQSTVTFAPTVGTTYFVIIDSAWMASGTYHVDVSGVIVGGGACDPAIPNYTCESGFACRESTPGALDWLCRVALCSDTLDNDGDTFTDFPNDPGCATPSDDAEDFPNPVTACSDGLDNDGDGFIDYAGGDIGCGSAADNGELDECIAGVPVIDHPGGTLAGDTIGGTNVLAAPAACDSTGSSGTSQELVYVFNNTQTLTNLRLSTAGTGIETILYVRYNDCGSEGPLGYCNDGAGLASEVNIASPPVGNYFAVVDGVWSAAGPIAINITGTVAAGAACSAGDANFVCETGYACTGGVCAPAACNDGADNDGDGDIDFPFDPGCTSNSDGDETDPMPTPQCGDGLDNDGDGFTDYPADSSCGSAADDNEACASFGSDTFGYQGCQETFMTGMSPCDDISATGMTACTSDDCLTTVTIPFTFDYYGLGYTSLSVVSNGKIAFPGTTAYTNSCTIESNTIAAYWDDLYPPSGGAVRYQTLGTAPDRRFVVNWNVPHISGGTLYDIRAVLHETSNDIDFCYVDTITNTATTDLGASATTGIQGPSSGVQFSCNTGTVTEGLHLHFDHP